MATEIHGLSNVVAPAGIEPASSESESEILSIVLRSQNSLQKSTSLEFKFYLVHKRQLGGHLVYYITKIQSTKVR